MARPRHISAVINQKHYAIHLKRIEFSVVQGASETVVKLRRMKQIKGRRICIVATGFFCTITNKGRHLHGLFTNNHMFGEKFLLRREAVEFSYKDNLYSIHGGWSFTCKSLDVTFIEISLGKYRQLDQMGIRFASIAHHADNDFAMNDTIFIMQHPNGGKLEQAVGFVTGNRGDDIEYTVSTDSGSSGSPVFDTHGNVIGIHKQTDRDKNVNIAVRIRSVIQDIYANVPHPRHCDMGSMVKGCGLPHDKSDTVMQYTSTPSLLATISSTGKGVFGLTLLGDSLYAVRVREKCVSQYNLTTLSHVSNINVADTMGKGYDLDIASCVINNCLYVSDYTANIIHRIQLPANNITNWRADEPTTLSVTQNGNVLVTSYKNHTISEFTTHGTVVRQVDLTKSGITHPCHSILLPTGEFLLCHADSKHRVVKFSEDGTIGSMKTYGGSAGSGPVQLNSPRYLAVDNGFVLVADYSNNKIQLLSGDLSHATDLITKTHGLALAIRLCLDEKTGRLFIGSANGSIQVYQVLAIN